MNKIKIDCEGCRVYHKGDTVERLCGLEPRISRTETCPCMICLVKAVCEYPCDNFRQYATNYDLKRR